MKNRRVGFASLFAAGALALAAGAASAQSPLLKVETSSGDSVMYVSDDGGFVVKGAFNIGSIPAEGAGVRMMWHPAKGAFRAGRADGTEWDDANVGPYSVAMGVETEAHGEVSTALGFSTVASGFISMAMGSATEASGDYSTAMGYGAEARGSESTAMGYSTEASGAYSTAMGSGTEARGSGSTAMGWGTIAATPQSLSIGEYNSANSTADNSLFVVGNGEYSDRSDALVLDGEGNLTIAGTLTESSDIRLKTEIEPVDDVLSRVLALTPIHYRFKPETGHPDAPQIGLSAQEVREQFPALVSENSDGYLSVSYTHLTAALVGAIGEQQTTIEVLRERVEDLEHRLERLEGALEGGSR